MPLEGADDSGGVGVEPARRGAIVAQAGEAGLEREDAGALLPFAQGRAVSYALKSLWHETQCRSTIREISWLQVSFVVTGS